jgi:phage portal protein BeeE
MGVSSKVLDGTYDENEFQAFYESTIEPLALQMSLEYSRKLFTPRERAFGNRITFSSERLEFSSASTRIQMARELVPLGLLTVNEARRLLALPPVEDGDKRLQTLNVVNAAEADKYQLTEESK